MWQLYEGGGISKIKSMNKFNNGLLTCSICDSDLVPEGKDGALLKTKCPNCGITSGEMNPSYAAQESISPVQKESKVEVYHIRRAPASVTG